MYDITRRELLGTVVASAVVLGADGKPQGRVVLTDDGIATVYAGKVEEGQGARTELMMAAAEELGLPPERIRVVLADTDIVPDDGVTAGSRTTPATVPQVRKAAAELRSSVSGKLPERKAVFGQPHGRHNGRDLVTGAHRFPSDVRLEAMLYAAVLRPPSYNARLADVDLTVEEPVRAFRDGDFVGCVAPTAFEARRAVEALAKSAKWKEQSGQPSNAGLAEHLRNHAQPDRARPAMKGDVDPVLARAEKKLKATYTAACIQHAPMEPRAAAAEWKDGRLTVWTGTSNPFAAREGIAKACGVSAEKVRVVVPDFGGGFGGKHTPEAGIEAARLAKASGKPVMLRWTRAEEFTWAYCRPAAIIDVDAALGASSEIAAWRMLNYNSGASGINTPYRVEVGHIAYIPSESPLRQGSYRALAATANNFARECAIDELAALAGADLLEFRLQHLRNDRIRDVLTAATKKFGWAEKKRERRNVGLACGTEKDSVVAACVEVAVDAKTGAPRVLEVCQAFECGAIINPANLQAQVEGSIIMALGGALHEQIRFAEGKLLTNRFSQYRVPRLRDVPKIEVVLVDRQAASVGAGETPMIALAPAIAGAVHAATGRRLRSLPFSADAIQYKA